MKENSLHQSPTDSGRLYSFILVLWYYQYRDIWVIIINSFVAPHSTTRYYFLFYVRCQDMCLLDYSVATVHCQHKVLFI